MKTYNHIYINRKNLELFVEEHHFKSFKIVLIQCFDGLFSKEETTAFVLFLQSMLPQAIIIGTNTDTKKFIISFSIFDNSNDIINQTADSDSSAYNWSSTTLNAFSNLINITQHKVDEEIARNREKDKMMLAQSKQATMGEMMSMIAHQWRQPIATIGLISDNLAIDVALDDISSQRIAESTELISKQVHYLSKTIDDFSNYFRPDNIKKRFLIGDFFKELSEIVGKSLEHKNIIFGGDFDGTDEICAYKQELFQVCINIINNAKDAILEKKIEGGTIVFMHKHTKGKDQIQIIDNAGGIDAAIAQKIFDPYFSTKDEKHGTGLGLYISKTIVEQNLEGDLSQYNDAGGSVFLIQIPDKATCNV